MQPQNKVTRSLLVLALASPIAVGCNSNKPPARTAGDCAKLGAKTGVAGAKTGVTTGVEGVKAAGSAVGGFFEGGSREAGQKWEQGKANTKATATKAPPIRARNRTRRIVHSGPSGFLPWSPATPAGVPRPS